MVKIYSTIDEAKADTNSQPKDNHKLSKRYLLKPREIQALLTSESKGTITNKCFSVIFQRCTKEEIGLAARFSKKYVKLSVKRHLCYRIWKELFRTEIKFLTPVRILVFLREYAKDATKKEIWEFSRGIIDELNDMTINIKKRENNSCGKTS